MSPYKTPGVYIEEMNAFPGSIVQVETAIPAFIGYTEKAERNGKSLIDIPCRISSFSEFKQYFGAPSNFTFELSDLSIGALKATRFYLYHSVQMFYINGGSTCYITSVGGYERGIDKESLASPISSSDSILDKIIEPTMIVIPDALGLKSAEDCYDVYNTVLEHCQRTQNRIGIFDIYNGFNDSSSKEDLELFRNSIGSKYLNYSAAYYPWVNATVVDSDTISFANIESGVNAIESLSKVKGIEDGQLIADLLQEYTSSENNSSDADKKRNLHKGLMSFSPSYRNLIEQMVDQLNVLPCSSILAGVMTNVDNTRGVWKAPANVSLTSVIKPTVHISNDEQENMNVDAVTGKSINAIRLFPGSGTLVWGARTLDGNSLDWRYINVRRTMIMIEQSIELALRGFVFEPNTSSTWVTVESMINNFLTQIWKQGGLAGSSPSEAFDVQIGLGSTMTPLDILEGRMIVNVKVAVVRPAEFIIIHFQQQMQKS